jgi:ribonuclease HI
MFDPHAIKIFVDGSALPKNPGRAGFAAWIEYPDSWELDSKEITLSNNTFEQSTNQRMELLACIWAHEWVRQNIVSGEIQRVQIITDSRYVFENRTRPQFWRSQGWRNAEGRPIENDDLWKTYLSLSNKMPVRTDVLWTPGKKSAILKFVDKSAKAAAKKPISRPDLGFRSGKVGRSKNKVAGAETSRTSKSPQPTEGI